MNYEMFMQLKNRFKNIFKNFFCVIIFGTVDYVIKSLIHPFDNHLNFIHVLIDIIKFQSQLRTLLWFSCIQNIHDMKLTNTTYWYSLIDDIFEFFYGNNLASLNAFSFINNTIASLRYFLCLDVLFFKRQILFHFNKQKKPQAGKIW